MIYQWLITITLFVTHLNAVSLSNSGWRHFYIAPSDSAWQERCPTDHCYSLQDVIKNQSYFFESNTMLELIPGRYDITERVGQLVIANVSNFVLKGSLQINSTIIYCQQNATFGLTFANADDIVISDIQISHCCAKLTVNITTDATRVHDYVRSELDTHIKQWLGAYQGSCNAQNRFPCCATIASIDNRGVAIRQITVLHSKEVGVLVLRYTFLNISNSLLAYSGINCIIYVSNSSANTVTTLTNNQIQFGKEHSFNLASGVNIILVSISFLNNRFDSINMSNITLTSNGAPKGNVYLLVYRGRECANSANVQITITNNSITSTTAASGISMEYIILERIPLSMCICQKYNIWPQCIQPGRVLTTSKDVVTYHIQNTYFEGSCVTVKNLVGTTHMYFNIILNKVRIHKSLCPVALTLENVSSSFDESAIKPSIHNGSITISRDVRQFQVYIQGLVISSSRNNIMLLTAQDNKLVHVYPIQFLGNTTLTDNQGSVVAVRVGINLEGNVHISNNHAHNHESVFVIKYASAAFFQGDIVFINNRGMQGGAISAHSSKLYFQGRVQFISNVAQTVGGGISLTRGSKIYLEGAVTTLTFHTNTAMEYGGGLFVEETLLWESDMTLACFAKTFNTNNMIAFDNNRARLAGMALFGGWIDICSQGRSKVRPTNFFKFGINYNKNHMHMYSDISSNASRVCICKNSVPLINISIFEIITTPGKTFAIEAVAVGQRFGVVPAIVNADFQNQDGNEKIITELQRSQNAGTYCKELSYTVRSHNKVETMRLVIDRPQVPKPDPMVKVDTLQFQQLEVIIHLKECPPGLTFDSSRNICVCHYWLEKQGIQCNSTSQTVIRNAEKWISATDEDGIAISHHYPYDYCKSYALSLNLFTPDEQCALSHSGTLCGICQPGKSQVLGT